MLAASVLTASALAASVLAAAGRTEVAVALEVLSGRRGVLVVLVLVLAITRPALLVAVRFP